MNNNNLNLNENNEREEKKSVLPETEFRNTEQNEDINTGCLKTDKSSCHLSDNIKYTQEIWKNISGFDDYMVSNLGRVKSFKRNKETVLKGHIDLDGYVVIKLANNNDKTITKKAHQFVAEAFIPKTEFNPDGSNINGILCVNHKDGNKLNNTVENLEWCDVAYNNRHAAKLKAKMKKLQNLHISSNALKLAIEIEYLRSLGYKWEDISNYYKISERYCRRLYSAIDKNNKLPIEEALKLYKNTEDKDAEN